MTTIGSCLQEFIRLQQRRLEIKLLQENYGFIFIPLTASQDLNTINSLAAVIFNS